MESEQKKKENIALPQSNHDFDKNQEEIQIHESQRRYGEEGCRLAFLDILESNCQIYSVDLKKKDSVSYGHIAELKFTF